MVRGEMVMDSIELFIYHCMGVFLAACVACVLVELFGLAPILRDWGLL